MTGPNTECQHKQVTHRHGSNACYVLDRCRCEECRTVHAAYDRRMQRWRGEFPREPRPLVDPGPARAHVLELMAAGMGFARIGQHAGVPPSVVGAIIWGRNDRQAVRIRRDTEAKLLACQLDLADGVDVDAREARLIVDELLAAGWTKMAVGRRVHGPTANSIQLGEKRVLVGTLRKLRTLLFEPVPPRRWKDGRTRPATRSRPPNIVVFDTPGVRLPVVDGEVRGRFDPDAVGTPKRALVCRFCGRPLADHGIMERCTVRQPTGFVVGLADATV